MATVDFKEASCSHPDKGHAAVHDLTLAVADGEFMVLLGPSGGGKTTALRMLAGLQTLESGAVLIDGEDVTRRSAGERNIAMVFKNQTFYPEKKVSDSLRFALKAQGASESAADRRIRQIAAELGLTDELDRTPNSLSGDERQRVAIGRALARRPRVYLLDEPLAAVDAGMRSSVRSWIASLQRHTGTTMVYVTTDHVEAMALGDRIAVLNDGVLQQVDTPRKLYDQPANTFVAGFVGSPPMNLVPGRVSNGWVFMGSTNVLELPIEPARAASLTTRSVIVGFRPEHARLAPLGTGIYADVESVEDLGHTAYVHCDIGVGREHRPVAVRCALQDVPKPGSAVGLMPELDKLHLFHGTTGQRL